MKKYIETIEEQVALYKAALRMACEYLQESLMGCPNEEDYELADNPTHGCYACEYFGNFRPCVEEQEEAFTEKAIECYTQAFLLRTQRKRNKESTQITMWSELKYDSG